MSHTIPTAGHILTAPFEQLLAEADAEVFDVEIPDPGFIGGAVQRRDGHIVLARPAAARAVEWEIVARSLLAEALGVDLSPLPSTVRTDRTTAEGN
jgi:hypothetical protein